MYSKKILKRFFSVGLLLYAFVLMLPAQSKESAFDSLDVARLQVMYDLTYREDTTHLEWANKERMVLLVGNSVSDFESYGNYKLDRIRFEKMRDGTYPEWFTSNGGDFVGRYMFQVFKNHPEGKMTVTDHVFLTDKFKYEEDLNAFCWDILDDTVSIEGYLCQKAMCDYGGRTWEAWFTEELPFSDGPYKFHGLPGLILKVNDTRKHYYFNFVSIEVPEPGTNIEWHDVSYYGFDYIPTTRKGLFKVEDDLRENIMNHFDERTSPDIQKRMYNVMQSRNNPIELDRK